MTKRAHLLERRVVKYIHLQTLDQSTIFRQPDRLRWPSARNLPLPKTVCQSGGLERRTPRLRTGSRAEIVPCINALTLATSLLYRRRQFFYGFVRLLLWPPISLWSSFHPFSQYEAIDCFNTQGFCLFSHMCYYCCGYYY